MEEKRMQWGAWNRETVNQLSQLVNICKSITQSKVQMHLRRPIIYHSPSSSLSSPFSLALSTFLKFLFVRAPGNLLHSSSFAFYNRICSIIIIILIDRANQSEMKWKCSIPAGESVWLATISQSPSLFHRQCRNGKAEEKIRTNFKFLLSVLLYKSVCCMCTLYVDSAYCRLASDAMSEYWIWWIGRTPPWVSGWTDEWMGRLSYSVLYKWIFVFAAMMFAII